MNTNENTMATDEINPSEINLDPGGVDESGFTPAQKLYIEDQIQAAFPRVLEFLRTARTRRMC